MPPQKKKIEKNTTILTDSNKPLDSYFISKSNGSKHSSLTENELQPVNITSLEIQQHPKSDSPINRENVLNNLKGQKIVYNLTDIKSKIELLTENELAEVFKIIKKNNEKYSTNKNGIFINLTTIKKVTVIELSNFLYFCENNDKIFDKEEEERARYKEMIIDS
jgi:hypothetical protein